MNLLELATHPPHAHMGAYLLLSSPSRFGRQGYLPLMHVARRYVNPRRGGSEAADDVCGREAICASSIV